MTAILRSFSTTRRQRKENEKDTQDSTEEARRVKREVRKDQRIGFVMSNLLGERSQNNSLMKHVVGVYMYVSGASQQLISVMSNIGDSSSYATVAGSGRQERSVGETIADLSDDTDDDADPDWLPDTSDDETNVSSEAEDDEVEGSQDCLEHEGDIAPDGERRVVETQTDEPETQGGDGSGAPSTKTIEDAIEHATPTDCAPTAPNPILNLLARGAGLLRRLSHSCRFSTRLCATNHILGHVYDNINMVFKVAEQILGRKDTQENGTCATVFPLYDAVEEDMQTSDLLASFDSATPLTMKDILHTPSKAALFHQALEHALLRTIVNSSDLFSRFRSDVDASLPGTDERISLHTTETYPLPAMNIDESSTTGNAEVLDTMFAELEYAKRNPKFADIVAPVFGDQLSIARLRIRKPPGYYTGHRRPL